MINLGKYDICFETKEASCNVSLKVEWKEFTVYQRRNCTFFIKYNGRRVNVFRSDDKRYFTYIERV